MNYMDNQIYRRSGTESLLYSEEIREDFMGDTDLNLGLAKSVRFRKKKQPMCLSDRSKCRQAELSRERY